MAVFSKIMAAAAVMYPLIAEPVLAGSIADIEHVVLFMQGNNGRFFPLFSACNLADTISP